MLQIATGKFFQNDVGRENHLHGVLYTNYRPSFRGIGLETKAGRLTPSSNLSGLTSLIYEVTERYEGGPAPGVLVSVGVEPFLKDMAAVISFGFEVTCTPDQDLARRLLGEAPLAPNAHARPKQYVTRIFDTEVWGKSDEAENFERFVADLIALKRERYQAALRAIRTYVGGLQRLGDDIDLAYTLLVASIESIAQGFDGHRAAWSDFTPDRRERIDQALADAPDEVARKVRDALLEIEHVALARRFKAYALENLRPAYFRQEASCKVSPIGRADLATALDLAYAIRSKYVHELKAIPRPLIYVHDHGEWTRVGGSIALTIQGLARLARTLIQQFVQDSPKIETEEYNYRSDIPGVVEAKMAPQYWVWIHDGFEPRQARLKLRGFLDLYASVLAKEPNAALIDIRDLLAKYETQIPTADPAHRLPMLALYYLFNVSVPEHQRREGWFDLVKGHASSLDKPSLETLAILLVLRRPVPWAASILAELREMYYRTRFRENGLRLPWLLEAAMDLQLAEAYRQERDEDKARMLVGQARENHPTMERLSALEDKLTTPLEPIDWVAALLPQSTPPTEQADPQSDSVVEESGIDQNAKT